MEVGGIYHVYDRGNDRRILFKSPAEFDLFVGLLRDARKRTRVRVLAYCLMPNHWHLILESCLPRDISRFVARLKQVHTVKVHVLSGSTGTGHVYQERCRSRLLESAEAIAACCRYVERNALSAGLVARAEDWRWGSLWHRVHGNADGLLDPMPVWLGEDWVGIVNAE